VDACLSRRPERRPGLDSVLAVLRAEPSPSARVPAPGAPEVVATARVGNEKLSAESRPLAPVPVPPPPTSPRWQDRFPQLASYLSAMRSIPSGEFTMGSDKGEDDEKPAHPVRLSGFRMGSTPATVGMWQEYCSSTGAAMPDSPDWGWLSDHPMVNVSWNDIAGSDGTGGFCAWASKVSGVRLTLPTESQWEYGALGGLDGKEYPWGDGFDASKLWCSSKDWGDAGRTAPVARTSRIHRNGYGLTDMAGNVWEWCLDWFGPYQPPLETRRVSSVESVPKPGLSGWLGGTEERTVVRDVSVPLLSTDPMGSAIGDSRVQRGASCYNNNPDFFRCANRDRISPDCRYDDGGFRLVSPGP
jgi:formylglycine-generating enzyme required for sulfatase activity